jgi:hypothetical protein
VKSVAVQRWSSVEVVGPVEGDAPVVSESVPLAGECPPTTGRMLDHLTLPAFEKVPEPTCEELERCSAYGGPLGAQGHPGRAVGT